MTDIRSPRLLYVKGILFVLLGCMASGILIVQHPSLLVAGCLAIAVWAFGRAYYFAFYVIERYIDGDFRFAGLLSVARYLLRRRRGDDGPPQPEGRS